MASLAYPATMVSLIISDVVGDKLDVISSGQTVPDGTTYGEAEKILLKYDLWEKLPPRAGNFFKAGVEGRIPETPELDDPVFDNVTNILIGSNLAALHAAARFAEIQGYTTTILSSQLTGEAREIARVFYAVAEDLKQGRTGDGTPCCILAGGEPTVTLKGRGKGGRNQEMALAFLNLFQDQNDMKGIVFLSSATDGEDGPTDVAGGLVHDGVLSASRDLDLSPGEYLSDNDSYNFLNRTKGLYYTGPTDTNICDIIVLLVEP
jgi:glycerate-2-kinase